MYSTVILVSTIKYLLFINDILMTVLNSDGSFRGWVLGRFGKY